MYAQKQDEDVTYVITLRIDEREAEQIKAHAKNRDIVKESTLGQLLQQIADACYKDSEV